MVGAENGLISITPVAKIAKRKVAFFFTKLNPTKYPPSEAVTLNRPSFQEEEEERRMVGGKLTKNSFFLPSANHQVWTPTHCLACEIFARKVRKISFFGWSFSLEQCTWYFGWHISSLGGCTCTWCLWHLGWYVWQYHHKNMRVEFCGVFPWKWQDQPMFPIMDSTQAVESFESWIEAKFEIMGSRWQFVQLSEASSESHLTEFRG